MEGKTRSVILPHGLKRLKGKKTYVLGYISVKQLSDPWKAFTKGMVHNLTKAQGSNIDIDMLVTRSFKESLEVTGYSGYETLGLQGSYLYPTVPLVTYGSISNMLETGIIEQNCLDVVYSSNKIAEDGNSIKIKRLYIGRVYDYSPGKDLMTLKMGDTYRTFNISKISTVDTFSKNRNASVKHLKLELEPLENGSTKLTLTDIVGEDNELIAKPWDDTEVKPSTYEQVPNPRHEPLIKLKDPEPSAPKQKLKRRPFNHLGAETKLESLYNEFITVVETVNQKDVRTSLKLKGFSVHEDSDAATLRGEAGITVEVALKATKIIQKKNSETFNF